MVEALDDAAGAVMPAAAGMAQGFEMLFQRPERGYLFFHAGDVPFDEFADPRTGRCGPVSVGQQCAYLGKIHAMLAASPDEVQALCVGLAVEPVACACAFGRRQEPFFFVVSDGDGLRAGEFGEFAYLEHGFSCTALKLRVAMHPARSRAGTAFA
jgi:hypothetical protein